MNNKNITSEKTYRGYKINNGVKKDFKCYTKVLDQVINQTHYMCGKHNKFLNVRLDLRNPDTIDENIQRKDMTRIIENAKRNLQRSHTNSTNKLDFHCTWTTEGEDANSDPHYHLFVSVNGNTVQNGYSVMDAFQKAVNTSLGQEHQGLVEFSNSNGKYGIMVDRNSGDYQGQINKAIYTGSYLAKVNTKENIPKGARVSSSSRLPADWLATEGNRESDDRKGSEYSPSYITNKFYKNPDEVIHNFTVMCPPEPWELKDDEDDFDK